MKAHFRKIKVAAKEVLVVHLEGKVDIDSCDLFRQACRGPLWGRPVLFNLQSLSCIGSSGLRLFLESMNDLAKSNGSDVRFCAVRSDFTHVLEATPLGFRPRFEAEADAIHSYHFDQGELVRPVLASETDRSLEG